jgi:type VI secretion system protein VasD
MLNVMQATRVESPLLWVEQSGWRGLWQRRRTPKVGNNAAMAAYPEVRRPSPFPRVVKAGLVRRRRLFRPLVPVALCAVATLVGCATGGSGADTSLLDKALQAVGLSKPPLPDVPISELPTLARKVTLRLHASEFLNVDAKGAGLSVVTRVYKLKDSAAFMQASYEALAATTPPRDAPFVQDIVEVQEFLTFPGVNRDVVESVPPQAKFLAVVAFFRAPAEARWRFVFETKAAADSGVTLGLHACAMSVAQGQPLNATLESQRLAGVVCQKEPGTDAR